MIVLALILLTLSSVASAQVRVWEEDVVIPTYPLGPDDVNPHFFALEGSVIYPYTMQDNLTPVKVDRTYRAWFLENEYLKLMALPEIGGRIQYVYDKRRGEEMFYHNRVIRPGHIALRGAWVSGGIEWNRGPKGHTVTSFSPVDVVGVAHSDGSASLVIGNIEMNFRTGWEVRLTLHPGRTFLDESIALYNPTDGFHPYYFWNNTAFPNRPKTRYIYPMTLGSDHNGETFFSWPVHEGRDLTWLVNYPEPTSVFAYRSVFDFFGAYDVDRDYGIVQVANHHVLPGKKAWTWGEADSGLASESVLTDEDGPYIEVQSGPLLTQADFALLAPGQEVRWREYWYPVFGLGEGYEFATKDLAVERVGREIRLHPTGRFDGALVVLNGVERRVDLTPERTETILVKSDVREISITVRHDGKELLSYRSPLAIPLETAPALEEDALSAATAEDAYLIGHDFDRRMEPVEARRWYERALAMDAMHYDALVALAVLDLEAGLYGDAAPRLDHARARDPDKGWAHYLAGVVAFKSGKLELALARGYLASKRHGLRSLGLGLAGRALMRLQRPGEALPLFRAAYAPGGQDDRRLFDALLIAALTADEKDEAVGLARGALAKGSLRLVPRAVLALAGEKSMKAFAKEARDYLGEDDFTILEAALAFDELGRRDAARRILEVSASTNPLTYYYLAYWGSNTDPLATAARLEHDRVFPSRAETIPVLQFVIERTGDERVHLMLGNLYAGLGRMDEAVEAWTSAKSSSVAHRSLAMTAWKREAELERAAFHFTEAIERRPSDQTLYRDLGRLRLEQGSAALAIELLSTMPVAKRRRADVTLLLARAYVADTRYGDAIDLLAATTFSNREGDSGTWSVFSKAHVERGIERMNRGAEQKALEDFEAALRYPKNLNVGRPARPHEARALFWKGTALGALGNPAEALAAWNECASNDPQSEEQRHYVAECQSALSSR